MFRLRLRLQLRLKLRLKLGLRFRVRLRVQLRIRSGVGLKLGPRPPIAPQASATPHLLRERVFATPGSQE